jgi:ferredoxin
MSEVTIGKVVVDKDLCIGSASCVAIAPDLFELDDDGKAIVKEGASYEDVVQVLDSAQSCPVDAIIVYDTDGNQIWPKV